MKRFIGLQLLIFIMTGPQVYAISTDNPKPFNPSFETFVLPGSTLGNCVQGIVQDSVGFLWFASQAGLHRYDGQNILTYRADINNINSLSSDYIESIFIDSKGIIWLTHWQQGGLTSFDPDRELFTRYSHDPDNPESLLNGEFSVVVEDLQGFIWIGGQQGLNRMDRETGKVKRFQHDPDNSTSLSSNEIRALYIDRQGTLWIGTGLPWNDNDPEHLIGGMNRYNPETESFTQFRHNPNDPYSLADNKVRAFLEDSHGNFWVGTSGDGLQKMNRQTGKFERLTYDASDPGKLTRPFLNGTNPSSMAIFSHITSFFEDHSGRLWITAVQGGLNVYDPVTGITDHFEQEKGTDKLSSNFLWQTYQTRDGTIWITSAGEGQAVFKVKERNDLFPFFKYENHFIDTSYYTHAVINDKVGNVWIGLSPDDSNLPGKLLKINRKNGSMIEIPFTGTQPKPNFLGDFDFDPAGNLVVSTNRGYYMGDIATSRFHRYQPKGIPDSLLNAGTLSSIHTRSGTVWFPGWEMGITRFNPKTYEYENYRSDPNVPDGLTGNIVTEIYEDSDGAIWVGGGTPWNDPARPIFLDRYNPITNTFEHFITDPAPGMAYNITPDNNGNLWFLDFMDGLYKLNPVTKQLKKYSSFNSLLPGGRLLSLQKTKDGTFWIGGEYDIIQFDPDTETMTSFGKIHGVKSARGNFNAGRIADDGEMLFGRTEGYHAFYPENIAQQSEGRLPDLRITGFRLLDEPITTGSTYNLKGVLNQPVWQTKSIELQHDENVFSFSVACFDFYEPAANQIQFMLQGYDRGWRKDIRDGETPSFINVPPGHYTFRLRGVNSFGTWNREGVSLSITVLPPWWKSIWAYGMYGLIIIGGVFSVDRVQRKRIKERERALVKEKELAQAKEIEKAYRELKATQSQLIQSEKMASLGELTAGIAHEIQNPLNFVNNFSEVNKELLEELMEELESGKKDDILALARDLIRNEEKIKVHGKRAETIVKNMLQHSRGDAGKKEAINLNAMAEEYVNLSFHGMRARDKSFNADFKLVLDENLPEIKVVPQDIGRVLLNLINNAFYAVAEAENSRLKPESADFKPLVRVSTNKLDDKVELRVSDNGMGIPDNIREKIFQPFFTTKPTGQGTGLGLSLSYDIVKAHGGELKVETKEGEFSEFIITLQIV